MASSSGDKTEAGNSSQRSWRASHVRRDHSDKTRSLSSLLSNRVQEERGHREVSSRHNSDIKVLCNACTYIYCINLKERSDKWERFQRRAQRIGKPFLDKVKRFEAIDGKELFQSDDREGILDGQVAMEWDATQNAQYSRKANPGLRCMTPGEVGCAMSHIKLWKMLADQEGDPKTTTMLILEDDAVFATVKERSRFSAAFCNAWKQVPSDWGFFYLGLSDRGERTNIDSHQEGSSRFSDRVSSPEIQLYRPKYGFHTHAYIITKATAQTLLQDHLPIVGPIDVWLADNQWFQIPVYCAVIANEGWRREDGTYEGAELVIQNRGKGSKSDIQQSSETW
eukprot:CAMPEP_0198285344 /NCGR_PEP_ID=MMETSP1449-20131203/4668_1 /TAXON_ID=420275 /ORGANISM="Attheya septentrionalis, Strain CCMP2084" /LENGTH=337 /DNA_ID=CAMNT_0043982749 /DNA_START=175 /DNA_END=1188 /DNA_ORIENTATION=-